MKPKTDEQGVTVAVLTTNERKLLARAIDVLVSIDLTEGRGRETLTMAGTAADQVRAVLASRPDQEPALT